MTNFKHSIIPAECLHVSGMPTRSHLNNARKTFRAGNLHSFFMTSRDLDLLLFRLVTLRLGEIYTNASDGEEKCKFRPQNGNWYEIKCNNINKVRVSRGIAAAQGEDNKCLLVGKLMMLKMNSLQSSAEEWFDEEKFLSLIIYSWIRFREEAMGKKVLILNVISRRESTYVLPLHLWIFST